MDNNGFIVNDDMFGSYVKIPTGVSMDMHVYKVVGRIESNGYCDTPIMGGDKIIQHREIVPVLNVVHCGVCEDTIIRVALSDCEIVRPPNDPLTEEQIQEMGGEPYWHVGLQEDSAPPHWNILDPFYAKRIKDYGYGKRWLAYRRKPDTQLDRNEETCEYCKAKSCEICVNKGDYIYCEEGECYGECPYFDAAPFCRRCGRKLNYSLDRMTRSQEGG